MAGANNLANKAVDSKIAKECMRWVQGKQRLDKGDLDAKISAMIEQGTLRITQDQYDTLCSEFDKCIDQQARAKKMEDVIGWIKLVRDPSDIENGNNKPTVEYDEQSFPLQTLRTLTDIMKAKAGGGGSGSDGTAGMIAEAKDYLQSYVDGGLLLDKFTEPRSGTNTNSILATVLHRQKEDPSWADLIKKVKARLRHDKVDAKCYTWVDIDGSQNATAANMFFIDYIFLIAMTCILAEVSFDKMKEMAQALAVTSRAVPLTDRVWRSLEKTFRTEVNKIKKLFKIFPRGRLYNCPIALTASRLMDALCIWMDGYSQINVLTVRASVGEYGELLSNVIQIMGGTGQIPREQDSTSTPEYLWHQILTSLCNKPVWKNRNQVQCSCIFNINWVPRRGIVAGNGTSN